jgi:hypothetical protein
MGKTNFWFIEQPLDASVKKNPIQWRDQEAA